MRRSGLTSASSTITSSNCVTSPRTTLTLPPSASNAAASGLMSMQTTSSPRPTSRGMSRRPMNPVPPMTTLVMSLPP